MGIRVKNNEGGCWSYLGQAVTSGPQDLNLGNGCVVGMIIEHEFLHAMGMLHEQSRPDRDNFLIINWNNIQPNYHSQYEMMSSNVFDDTGDDLDIWSVMMYPWYGFLTTEASQQGLSSMTD